MKRASKLRRLNLFVTFFLAVVVAGLLFASISSYVKANASPPENIRIHGDTIDISTMTLRQKIAQMLIVYASLEQKEFYQNAGIGGLFLTAMESSAGFNETITTFQAGAKIPFVFSADVEGCVNAFQNFANFPSFSEIKDEYAAYGLGKSQGLIMRSAGIQIDFSPVVDLRDTIWKCRSFPGTPEEVSKKAASYVAGLQSTGTIATAKHYPGRTLDVRDPHQMLTQAEISKYDLMPFAASIRSGAKAVMVSHVIASGEVYSDGKPAVVSRRAIDSLKKDFTGLVITDDVNMLGLRQYYNDNKEQMYIDLFAAGNDMILNALAGPQEINYMITVVEAAVRRGEIPEKQIDASVEKILAAKGYKVSHFI